jgi:uncharacterized membrane protein YphA (DoxX/SURF4 family)
MFPTFPGGCPGVGLLLLRVAVVVTVLAQCIAYAADWRHLGFVTAAAGFLAIASSVLLLIGYLTPFSAVLVALTSLGTALAWFPPPNPNLFDTKLATALVTVIAVAIACLGPGAFSLDARLFGRREITIPTSSPSSQS